MYTNDTQQAIETAMAARWLAQQQQQPQPVAAPEPAPKPVASDDAIVITPAMRRNWREHFTRLCDYAERVAWLGVIGLSFVAFVIL